MLITRLGNTRRELLRAIEPLTNSDLWRASASGGRSIGQILLHLAETERSVAEEILGAVSRKSERAPEYDLAEMRAVIPSLETETETHANNEPVASTMTKHDLIHALEESRFRYLQRVFNETHEATLTQKSVTHPPFGLVSLKSLVDFIWLHEQYHTEQIEGMEWASGAD